MMIELNDLIQVYPNALDKNVCEFLIDFLSLIQTNKKEFKMIKSQTLLN
jgi:hypothetical protein